MLEYENSAFFKKNWPILKVRDQLRDQIYYHSSQYSADEVTRLGARYLACHAESYLYREDWFRNRGMSPERIEPWRQRRLRFEAALFKAQQEGDYTLVKRELLELSAPSSEFSQRLENMINYMKDKSEPFKPPAPAWMQTAEV